jgi:hypothetical protein
MCTSVARKCYGAWRQGRVSATNWLLVAKPRGNHAYLHAIERGEVIATYEQHREAMELHDPLPHPRPRGPARADSR